MPTSLFNYFNLYRVVIGALLVGMTFSNKFAVSDFRDLTAFQGIAASYFAVSFASLLAYRFRLQAKSNQVFFACFIDIGFLHALFYAGEGITGGLSNLVIISVAASNIMLRGAPAYALAAVASLLSLSLEFDRMIEGYSVMGDVARAGVAGAIYFAAAFILQNLARQISQSERLAEEQQQNIAELQALNHQIIQSMRTGIIVCDSKLDVLVFNQACTDLVGMREGKAIPKALERRIRAWRELPSIRSKPFQVTADLPMVQANFSRMEDADKEHTLIFLEDTRLVTQRAQQLKLASLGRLTASIAHEVRNPLGAISHATQLLVESDDLVPADRKMTDIIQRHCVRVNGIIENTLTLSRRAKPDVRELELRPWLEKVIDQLKDQGESYQRLTFSADDEDARARFDASQLEQVLTNLIGNALYHGAKVDPQSEVEIRLLTKRDSGQSMIEVLDAGSGVSKDDQKHLFEPFFTTESSGTGLGLYISRELCEANQANLNYLPREGGGSCFRVTFAHHNRIV
jgi:two-component system, NtrC family, sensor histidine kinase PilS